jgi:hypothetical protein
MKPWSFERRIIQFWKKVQKTDTCWIWIGAIASGRYGMYNGIGAHKFAYQVTTGTTVPDGFVVMHICDNPICVNPSHLKIGTSKDNSIDMRDKGRNTVFLGEEHGGSKLTEEEVLYIRANYVKGNRWKPGNSEELAIKFGIHRSHVYAVANNKQWQWLKEKQ